MNVAGIVSASSLAALSLGALIFAHYEDALEAAWIRLVNRMTGIHPTPEEEGEDGYEYY